MLTKNVATSKKRVFGRSDYKHKLEGSRDKKEHIPYIPMFFGLGLAVICFMLLFVGVGVASAATYYVATDGDDSYLGNETHPWKTIQKAADTLIAGDTVYIKAGTYNERVIPQHSGSPGKYITYTAYPGHTVTIDGTDKTCSWGGVIHIIGKNYIRTSELKTINSEGFGIRASNSDHIIIEKCYTYNTYQSGIVAHEGSSNIIVDNNEVELACNDGGQECITIDDVDTFEVKNNHIHHSGPGSVGGEGIDAKGDCSNGKIYNNHVHDINRLGIYIDAYDGQLHDIDVFQNTVHDCASWGIACSTEQGGLLDTIDIYNNIVYNCTDGFILTSFSVPGWKKNITVINNIFYNNNYRGIRIQDTLIENFVARNNICSQNNNQIKSEYSGTLTIDHNLIDGATEVYGTDYVTGTPKFVNPVAGDFHLQPDSPVINAGSSIDAPNFDFDGNHRPQGAGYDIGAYEYIVAGGSGTISGAVKDKDTGLGIRGATVTANGYSDPDGTDINGYYEIANAPTGTYAVTVSATGYQTRSQENVQVLDGQTTTVDFQLTEVSDLVGFWRFDEGSGTTAADSSEYSNNGAINGATWTTGKLGSALQFDGVDDDVDCDNGANLNITDKITIMTWVYPTASSYDQWTAILGKGNSAYRLHMHDNQFDFGLSIVGLPNQNLDAGSVFAQNQWAHVAATYNGTNMKIYINGALANSTAVSGAIKTNNYHLWIGGRSEDPKYFNGTIDEVKIYNRALSAEEIKADYEAGSEEKNPPARDTSPPFVTNPTATPATILLNDNSRPKAPGTNISQLNVTVTDDTEVDTVTIGLSPIGGSAKAQMSKIPGTDIWSVTVTATAGINLTHNLIVTATDIYGNSNTSVSIQLTVLRRGDVFRDNVVDRKDAAYIARYLAGSEPEVPNLVLVGDVVGENGDPTGDGVVDMKDAAYIARYEAGLEDEP